MTHAPTIATERLTLRPLRPADFDAFAAMLASPRAAHMHGPIDRSTAWGWFCSDAAHWPLFGHGALMIDVTSSGQTAGQVGINTPPHFPEPELGWLLYDGHEGHGYATEAARALRDHTFSNSSIASLVSYIDHDNRSSCAVAERLGAVIDPDAATPRGDACLVYRHPTPAVRP